MTPSDAEQGAQPSSEQCPLLGAQSSSRDDDPSGVTPPPPPEGRVTAILWIVLTGVTIVGLILVFTLPVSDWDDPFPTPDGILKSAPVIDGHIGQCTDHALPLASRLTNHNQIYPNSLGDTTRITYLRSISTPRCLGMLIYRG